MGAFIFPLLAATTMFLLGVIVGRLSKSVKRIGRFKINEGDPTKPAFWLELDHDLDVIERQGEISFQVLFHSPPEER